MNYSSDITDKEWCHIGHMFEEGSNTGRPRKTEIRTVVNAICYVARTGCQWRYLPTTYPNHNTVYYYYRKWKDTGVWEEAMHLLRIKLRVSVGRGETPTASIIDGQTVKSSNMCRKNVGYDGGKRIKGRKRNLTVDVNGWPIALSVTSAGVQDYKAAFDVMSAAKEVAPTLEKFWADAGYNVKKLISWASQQLSTTLEIVKRPTKQFKIVGWRWIVERTFGWLNNFRRLSKDYETNLSSSRTFVIIGLVRVMLARLTKT